MKTLKLTLAWVGALMLFGPVIVCLYQNFLGVLAILFLCLLLISVCAFFKCWDDFSDRMDMRARERRRCSRSR